MVMLHDIMILNIQNSSKYNKMVKFMSLRGHTMSDLLNEKLNVVISILEKVNQSAIKKKSYLCEDQTKNKNNEC